MVFGLVVVEVCAWDGTRVRKGKVAPLFSYSFGLPSGDFEEKSSRIFDRVDRIFGIQDFSLVLYQSYKGWEVFFFFSSLLWLACG